MLRVLSTKKLLLNQRELLLNAGVSFVNYDALVINTVPFKIPEGIENCIITSQNGAKSLTEFERDTNCFVVGKKTASHLSKNGQKVMKTARNGAELARFIVKNYKNEHFFYFCGKQRRDEIPTILSESNVSYKEIITYETKLNPQSFEQEFNSVLFFSPLGVASFAKANVFTNTTAICIGETTAEAAKKYTEQTIVANDTTIESTIAKAVTYLKKNIN